MAGRPKGEKSFAAMLRIAINEAGKRPGSTRLRDVAEQLVIKAESGDLEAIKEIANRIDGKVPQGIIGGDEDDNPIALVSRIERVIVNANAQDRDR
jgi:hypothetical protein